MIRDSSASGLDSVRTMSVEWAVTSDVGLVRQTNEDAALAIPGMYAVADGMGGHERGELASEATVDALAQVEPLDIAATRTALIGAISQAHDAIEQIHTDSTRQAGTTVSGAALVEYDGAPHWLVFNIGDSRTYRFAAGALEQVTVDHSQVQELVDGGYLTAEQARVDPRRNVITRALGAGMAPEPDFFAFPAVAGETVLVCSDGLTGELPDAEIADILSGEAELAELADTLAESAVQMGGHDNITVVLLRPGEHHDGHQ